MDKKPFIKVKIEKIYVQIVRQIEDLIERGILKPGDKLPSEPVLAEQLGTSRPPLREALSALEMFGIIERRGRTGSFVKANTDTIRHKYQLRELGKNVSPYETLQARKIVETEIVRTAAETATKKDIEAVQKAFQEMKEKIEKSGSSLTLEDIISSDIKFHLSIAEATHNSVLIETVRYMVAGLRKKLWIEMKIHNTDFRKRFQKLLLEHKEILDALIKKDGTTIGKKMYEHLDIAEREMFGTS
ncbi:MAG: FCD domain-containing protein [Clostridia bacterium]|jgi:GntR family transcriptional repressor for pyruvate dehydrogenase complex|nr:FCD domain-containing protein [Clostridia bacterium]